MKLESSVSLAAPASTVFPFIATLDRYPEWLRLVHDVDPDDPAGISDPSDTSDSLLAGSVELRAKVGPFARSKRLRMQRSLVEPDRLAVFERAEIDGRDHARWALRAELSEHSDHSCELTMHLAYDGGLWSGGLLERVLDDEIRRGREKLAGLVSAARTR